MTKEYSSPIQFPCDFDIKIMGHATADFTQKATTIIKHHFPSFKQDQIKTRNSKDNNYIALTLTVKAENQTQLDSCYQELSTSPDVIMAL
jgi:uncharacterized protein